MSRRAGAYVSSGVVSRLGDTLFLLRFFSDTLGLCLVYKGCLVPTSAGTQTVQAFLFFFFRSYTDMWYPVSF